MRYFQPNKCPSYHASKLRCHIPNDDTLSPLQSHPKLSLVLTEDDLKEHQIDSIFNSKCQGCVMDCVVWVFKTKLDDSGKALVTQ